MHEKIINRCLSLRRPQSESLSILVEMAELLPLKKDSDLAADLEAVRSSYPQVTDFERDFPSLCFALATGVGKTRLMGAFIAWLHLAKGFRNFLVLAPNLTIYNKLITDFTPNTPKYVFAGLNAFSVNPPEVITGDNYEAGQGTRDYLFSGPININIFNISKINSEVRGDKAPRMKRLMETLGQSYFNYLSELDDLVLLMDEAHRYRASAGLKAINDLKPVLGLELTATPQVESGAKQPVPFQNVIYDYPLAKAMEDGFIKEPAVATRENFNAKLYDQEQLERLKLEDGVRIHETVKTELAVHAANLNLPLVKPFMLVIARDTTHAGALQALFESAEFFEGRYQGRVITVHSAQKGEEKDETIERLLKVESPDEPTEIVIHVNMLKEGWDVTNLYTIVPLRTANSRTLVEQSIGRGLRLPYGKKTGVPTLDRLTIVAHDHFDEIVREASDARSFLRIGQVIIGRDVDDRPKVPVLTPSCLDLILGREARPLPVENFEMPGDGFSNPVVPSPTELVADHGNKRIIEETLQAIDSIRREERLPTARSLERPELRQKLIEQVKEKTASPQGVLGDFKEAAPVDDIVDQVTKIFVDNSIDIPKVVVTPDQDVNYTFTPFTLNTSGLGHLNPVEQAILIQLLRTTEKESMAGAAVSFIDSSRPTDHLVAALIDFNDIVYEEHGPLLHNLAGQMIDHLRGYLTNEDDLLNVLQYYQKQLANLIHAQMQNHYHSGSVNYEVTVTEGFNRPAPFAFSLNAGDKIRYFRHPVQDKANIRSLAFQGFAKCLYPMQKFDSDTEREFAVLLEDEPQVLKWFKPGRKDFHIYYSSEKLYEPDFVVEMIDRKLICEPKMEKDLHTEDVKSKAEAARKWAEAATAYELKNGGKPWHYHLISHTAVKPSATLNGLLSASTKS